MELLENDEIPHAPRKARPGLLTVLLAFLAPALVGILAVVLGG